MDDNIEKCRDERVLNVRLDKEGPGLESAHLDQVAAMASGRGCVCVFDFDCTLSKFHMYKVCRLSVAVSKNRNRR